MHLKLLITKNIIYFLSFFIFILYGKKNMKIYKSYINISYHSNVELIMVRSKVIKSE